MHICVHAHTKCLYEGEENVFLSHDITVFQWITSCHKNRMTTLVITLWRVYLTSLTTSVSTMRFHFALMFTLKALDPVCKGQLIDRILYSWSIHIKFMKFAEGSFHNFISNL